MRNLILGLVIAAIALGVGIYVMMGNDGNQMIVAGESNSCEHAPANAKTLAPLLEKTDLAGIALADTPESLSELSFKDENGKIVTLADWKGRTVLLNLWATWCVPCREEMPALEGLEKMAGDEKFQVVPVSVDLGDNSKPKNFYSEINLQALPFFHDGKMKIFNDLKKRSLAFGMPTTILMDEHGCSLGVLSGPAHWDGDHAVKLIEAVKKLEPGSSG